MKDWVVIGGGIAGISIAEILSRNGHDVTMFESKSFLASDTSGLFHEWLHMGSLYSLVPGSDYRVLKYILGAIDDLIEYYSFPQNNLCPTESGMKVLFEYENPWFRNTTMDFKFKKNPWNIPWQLAAARSAAIIARIHKHDWLRRRAGGQEVHKYTLGEMLDQFIGVRSASDQFVVRTPDLQMNSRNILTNLVDQITSLGNKIHVDEKVIKVTKISDYYIIQTDKDLYKARNVVVAAGEGMGEFGLMASKPTYAPMVVVSDLDDHETSYVELDMNPSNARNLLIKGDGWGLAGGYSYNSLDSALVHMDDVVRDVIRKHGCRVEHTYMGVKTEFKSGVKSDRNFLFEISQNEDGVWSVLPGKFTMAFSMAPEFYRRAFHRNSARAEKSPIYSLGHNPLIAPTVWQAVKQGHYV